ncbi:MAG TPA: hypothetical protein PK177_02070, partial [Burkholderiaceae bacterium]|nr:hypothetical protein [Burkholderiaceae bacterium]
GGAGLDAAGRGRTAAAFAASFAEFAELADAAPPVDIAWSGDAASPIHTLRLDGAVPPVGFGGSVDPSATIVITAIRAGGLPACARSSCQRPPGADHRR